MIMISAFLSVEDERFCEISGDTLDHNYPKYMTESNTYIFPLNQLALIADVQSYDCGTFKFTFKLKHGNGIYSLIYKHRDRAVAYRKALINMI